MGTGFPALTGQRGSQVIITERGHWPTISALRKVGERESGHHMPSLWRSPQAHPWPMSVQGWQLPLPLPCPLLGPSETKAQGTGLCRLQGILLPGNGSREGNLRVLLSIALDKNKGTGKSLTVTRLTTFISLYHMKWKWPRPRKRHHSQFPQDLI